MYVAIWGIIIVVCLLFLIPTIGTNVIFLGLGILLAVVFIKRNADLKKNIYKMPEDALHITNVDKGGIFKLTGVGKNSEELNLKVLAKHLYREGDYYWWELECDKGDGEKVWVEVEDDDETIVSIVLEKLTLKDINVSKSRLEQIDDNESGSINYKGRNFRYTESDEAIFYRFCDDKRAEKLYYWDFQNGNNTVSIEKWSDNEFQVFYSQIMKPAQVTVYSNKTERNA